MSVENPKLGSEPSPEEREIGEVQAEKKSKKIVLKSGQNDIQQSRETGMSETYLRSANKDIQKRIDALAEVIAGGGDKKEIAREKATILSKIEQLPKRYELESDPGAEDRLMTAFREKLMTDDEKEEEKEKRERQERIAKGGKK